MQFLTDLDRGWVLGGRRGARKISFLLLLWQALADKIEDTLLSATFWRKGYATLQACDTTWGTIDCLRSVLEGSKIQRGDKQ
jgi:hypothetical protein